MTTIDTMKRDLEDFARLIKEVGISLLDLKEIADSGRVVAELRERVAQLEATLQVRNTRVSQLVTELANANTGLCKLVDMLRRKRDGLNDPHEDLIEDVARTLFLAGRNYASDAQAEGAWQGYLSKASEHPGDNKFVNMARAVLRVHGRSIADAA